MSVLPDRVPSAPAYRVVGIIVVCIGAAWFAASYENYEGHGQMLVDAAAVGDTTAVNRALRRGADVEYHMKGDHAALGVAGAGDIAPSSSS